ncbi:pentatricopeptide repeat-containing protein At4g02750-like [Selaginella moellendorffii]|uniref:pentatricopeptide repeat-containing protein At4g02750-like n=1 Tax=Selaginella moellendorffii TaxID=88036 RepID=UPI000D1C8FF3|nr:pentatricopeptide repeat-containing protein At4g02750-like [Selaginella moellendorffii]|eukprot:XP_024530867.1 pentatricopeptide repeat-containing protein At4g02750-like [Selaginella moellendorffii]
MLRARRHRATITRQHRKGFASSSGTGHDSDIRGLRAAIEELELCDRVRCDEVYARLLRQCADLRALPETRRIDAHISASAEFHGNRFLGNLLVKAYGNCGSVDDARSAFAGIRQTKNSHTWNLLLAAYAKNGHREKCVGLFEQIPEKNVMSWNFLIQAHSSKDELVNARKVLEKMPHRNMISFTILISCHTQYGDLDLARDFFDQMPEKDTVAWNSMLQAYVRHRDIVSAKEMFDAIAPKTLVTLTTMIRAYAQTGHIDHAREIFDTIHHPDAIAWNIMIQGYCDAGSIDQARILFQRMPDPDAFTCSLMLSGFAAMGLVDDAKALFDRSRQEDPVAWNSMITAYAHSGRVEEAKFLFDQRPDHHKHVASSWNAMIAAYAENGHLVEAAGLLEAMPPAIQNEISWNTLLCGFVSRDMLDQAKDVFERIPIKSVLAANTMLAAYALTGQHIKEAMSVFTTIDDPDPVSWASIVGAHARAGQGREAIRRFQLMDLAGVRPKEAALTAVLDACSSISSSGLRFGRIIHGEIEDDRGLALGNSLLNMYGKCGASIEEAEMVFARMATRNTVSWNVMLAGYAQNGHSSQVLELFAVMILEGEAPPSKITLVSVLSACSHAGLLHDGLACFASIRDDFGIGAHEDHYKCVVDLLGRSGQLEAAESFIQSLPFKADSGVWTALLSACSSQGSVHGGARAALSMVDTEPGESSLPYVMLSNIHATTN